MPAPQARRWTLFTALAGPLICAPACQKPSPAEDSPLEPVPPKRADHDPIAAGKLAAEAVTAEAEAEVEAEPEPEPEPPWTLPEDYLQFSGACEPGDRITLAFAGDLLLHQELQRQAYAEPEEVGAQVLWADIADLLAEPDLTYLNLEGPMAPGLDRDFLEVEEDPGRSYDRVVYSAYPRFNYHPSIAKDLVRAGVDIVSTANNHALDRGPLGVERTIEALRKAKLDFVGTRKQGAGPWHTITEVEGVKLAWIACTNNTNRVPDELDQVLSCGRGREVEKLIQRLRGTGRYAKRDAKVDAVIVTPHWGREYRHAPREKEQKLARKWIDAGALAVVGSHPHVVQPWAKLVGEAGNEGLVMYSLGNFASHQPELSRRSSLLLYLDLIRRKEDGAIAIAGARYLPLHVRQDEDRFFVEAVDRAQGPADARALLVALLGPANLVAPDEAKRGDPHCDEDWRPHPIPEWAELDEPFVIPGTEPEDDEDDEDDEDEPETD